MVIAIALALLAFSAGAAVAAAVALPTARSHQRDARSTIAHIVLGVELSALLLLGLWTWWFLSQIHIG
ncbi:MAG: hypothetical protein ACRD2W_24265 [Acidimicrobiales bacterium]